MNNKSLYWFTPFVVGLIFIAILFSTTTVQGYKSSLNKSGVPKAKIDNCMVWALGEDYPMLRLSEVDTVWNERHGDIFIMRGSDLSDEAFQRIGKAYLEYITGGER